MKKFNAFELIGIGVAIYLVCIFFGVISKQIFGFDVDVLSASATLFAAAIAIYLFNDWREQYRLSSLEKIKLSLHNLFNAVDLKYTDLRILICVPNRQSSVSLGEYTKISNEINGLIESLILELDYFELLLADLNVNKSDLIVHPTEIKDHAIEIYANINIAYRLDEFLKMINSLKPFLSDTATLTKLKTNGICVNKDIQKLIMKTLKNSEGH